MKIIAACAATVLALGTAAPARAETVKVGVVLPYSGPNSDLGTQVDRAFDLYVKMHAKDLGNNKIELIKRDEGPVSGANARTVVTELITNDKVKLLVGFVFSPSAIAAAPLATQAKMPMIIANAGTAWITTLSPYIVRFSFSMWDSCLPDGDLRSEKPELQNRRDRLHRLPARPGLDARLQDGLRTGRRQVVDQVRLGPPGPVPDFTPFFQRVKDEHPDCFYVFVPSGSHAGAVMKTYGELGMRQAGVRLIGPMDLIPDYELARMSDAAIGLIVMSSYADDYTTPGNQEFVKAWHDAYGPNSYPDFMSAAAMDAMAGVFHVITTLNGNLDDGAKVIDTLKGWKHEGYRGPIEIDPQTRDVIQDEHAEEVIKKPDGKLGVKVLETIPQVKDECKVLKVGRCAS